MKHYFLILILILLVAGTLNAQKDEGVVLFEERLSVQRVHSENNDHRKASAPYLMHSKLFFNKTESLFRSPAVSDSSGERRINRSESTYYTNFKTGRRLREFYFFGLQYLIEEDICNHPWLLTDQTQLILGYSCQLATLNDTLPNGHVMVVKAWFAPALPHGIGPQWYGQLPGAILKLDFNWGGGEQIFEATKIKFRKLKKKEMKPPSEGTKITREEYNAMFK